MTLKELCGVLGISLATGQNWVRLGILVPSGERRGVPDFSEERVRAVQADLATGKLDRLRRRRNKSRAEGVGPVRPYPEEDGAGARVIPLLFAHWKAEDLAAHTNQILRHYAESFLARNGLPVSFAGWIPEAEEPASEIPNDLPEVCWEDGQDFLGYLYLSLSRISDRKAQGAYYTPMPLAKQLAEPFLAALLQGGRVLDPCCGSGNFLIALAGLGCPAERLYGAELDPTAAALARINLALFCRISDREFLEEHIAVTDTLEDPIPGPWEGILGNPPWGSVLPVGRLPALRARYEMAAPAHPEACAVFLEQAVRACAPGGTVSMILPEAVLTVQRHAPLREFLVRETAPLRAEYIGDTFPGVQCPAVLLTVRCGQEFSTEGTFVRRPEGKGEISYTIRTRREGEGAFSFHLSDEEWETLHRIEHVPGARTLAGSRFALGIVTGDNRNLLYHEPGPGREPVLRGCDISPFAIAEPQVYLAYRPETFQQSAPEEVYRAPEKLVYAFVSSRLSFACDRGRRLTLNSCNIVIPQLAGFSADYLLVLLNSDVLQFYWRKRYRSQKVLRRHLEELPLAPASEEEQRELVRLQAEDPEEAARRVRRLYGLEEAWESPGGFW